MCFDLAENLFAICSSQFPSFTILNSRLAVGVKVLHRCSANFLEGLTQLFNFEIKLLFRFRDVIRASELLRSSSLR